ncbi:hypothetical protein NDU88_006345 [Pleurodeles waltl]|uniref:Uncharacterized protein n=1 Tax=Pleurodeles waltl TaxID=8319 RepID=A0AAV7MYY4_PLEWA|nr:hypothetical protein NDU88_006345 [Pleurodeles waltl]
MRCIPMNLKERALRWPPHFGFPKYGVSLLCFIEREAEKERVSFKTRCRLMEMQRFTAGRAGELPAFFSFL